MRNFTATLLVRGLVCLAAGILSLPLSAEEGGSDKPSTSSLFRDPEDGQFDVSAWLASRYGFLPTPVIITGPTLGAGGGVNLLFLHDRLTGEKAPDGRHIPPNLSGIAAIATENGSKAAGAYHLGFWNQDRLRTTTFLGRPDVNLDFYPDVLGNEFRVRMNLEGWGFYQEVKARLGESNFFAGANYTYLTLTSSPVDNNAPDEINALLERGYQVGGLGATLEYDSRDTIFTPTRGAYGKLVAETHADWLGSDYDFMSYRGKLFEFLPVAKAFDLGLRVEAQSVGSDAPYFLYPSIEMRGIANKRYQGQHVFVAETELNWDVYERWHLIGFVGSGKAYGESKLKETVNFDDASWRSSKGLGFRYEIARKFGLQVGIDVAWGPEETAYYITVGSAWNAFY